MLYKGFLAFLQMKLLIHGLKILVDKTLNIYRNLYILKKMFNWSLSLYIKKKNKQTNKLVFEFSIIL